ncbi:MAG: low temperature requirement protein A [Actinoplanes sp.]
MSSTRNDDQPAPLIEPPRLRTTEARGASRLELFFDLAYLWVLAELAAAFVEDLTWHGAGVFAGMLTVVWWSWVTTTLYANRFDTNDVLYRLAKLGVTAGVIGMAASVHGEDTLFAASFLATRVLLLVLYLRAWRHVTEARDTIAVYLATGAGGAVLWAVSLPLDGLPRYLLWAAGILVEVTAPLLASRLGDNTPLHLQHLPERFGLLVMLVLGESIASLVAGLHGQHWSGDAVVAAVVAFSAVAALWWIYFDLGGAAGKRQLEKDGDDQETGVADAYVFGHLPVVIGLSGAAVGIEELVLHPVGELGDAAEWTLHGGVTLFLIGVAVVMAGTSGNWRAAWPWPGAVIPAVPLLALIDAPVLSVAGIALVLVAAVLAGMWAQRRGALRTAEA